MYAFLMKPSVLNIGLFLTDETVCKVLKNVTVTMLSKINITIDFNGPADQLFLKKGMVNLFQTSNLLL